MATHALFPSVCLYPNLPPVAYHQFLPPVVINQYTVLARLYAPPPYCIVVQRKRRVGRLIEFCTYAPSLRPPPPTTTKWFPGNSYTTARRMCTRPTIGEELYCLAEEDNAFDHFAVAISIDGRIVGHVTSRIGKNFLVAIFWKRHSSVTY